jgi:hypothetical protein
MEGFPMSKIQVFWKGLTEEERRELKALLKAIGCEILDESEEDAEVGLLPPDEGQEPNEDVLVVLMTPACTREPALDAAAKALTASGGRLIGIWPRGE